MAMTEKGHGIGVIVLCPLCMMDLKNWSKSIILNV